MVSFEIFGWKRILWLPQCLIGYINPLTQETPLNAFANRADPDQAALVMSTSILETLLGKLDIKRESPIVVATKSDSGIILCL